MAAVAAGSLIMFSLLAEKVVEPRSEGVAVQPRVPREIDAERSLTVPPPPPEQVGGTPPSGPATAVLISADVVEPGRPVTPSLPELRDPDETRFVFAEVDVVPRPGRIGIRVPKNTVTASVRPSERGDDCPGRPQKPRSPGTHPHGGPPACGNPHGEPPGQAGKDEKVGKHGRPAGASHGNSGDQTRGSPPDHSDGNGSSNEAPPGHSDDGGSSRSGGGNAPSAPPENPPNDHPRGGPPGQSKESSSGSSSSGHPHGGPPGQEKKKG